MMNFKENLYIIQTIVTIQGEGSFIGKPSILIRLAGCNCRCPWCDTPWSWTGKDARIITEDNFNDYIKELVEISGYAIKNLMITGGEPLLYKDNPLFKKLIGLKHFDSCEIETNGSLLDVNFIKNLSPRIKLNISPKLDRDWYIKDFNVDYNSLFPLTELLETYTTYSFKFVNDPKYATITEVFIEMAKIKLNTIYMMPLTPNRKAHSPEEFSKLVKNASLETLRLCIKNGYNFVPRLHLYLFDNENETF